MKHIIAIDGPAAAGKSTIAKRLAALLGYTYIDTGAMYRAVALACIRQQIPFCDEVSCGAVAVNSDIFLKPGAEGCLVFLDGNEVTAEVRTAVVAQGASKVSAIPMVRDALVAKQRKMAENYDVVMEGRDIGTVVFPHADYKFFLTASPERRAERRYQEMIAQGKSATLENVFAEMEERDKRDSTRDHSPLRQAADASYLDSTNLTMEDVIMLIQKQMMGAE